MNSDQVPNEYVPEEFGLSPDNITEESKVNIGKDNEATSLFDPNEITKTIRNATEAFFDSKKPFKSTLTVFDLGGRVGQWLHSGIGQAIEYCGITKAGESIGSASWIKAVDNFLSKEITFHLQTEKSWIGSVVGVKPAASGNPSDGYDVTVKISISQVYAKAVAALGIVVFGACILGGHLAGLKLAVLFVACASPITLVVMSLACGIFEGVEHGHIAAEFLSYKLGIDPEKTGTPARVALGIAGFLLAFCVGGATGTMIGHVFIMGFIGKLAGACGLLVGDSLGGICIAFAKGVLRGSIAADLANKYANQGITSQDMIQLLQMSEKDIENYKANPKTPSIKEALSLPEFIHDLNRHREEIDDIAYLNTIKQGVDAGIQTVDEVITDVGRPAYRQLLKSKTFTSLLSEHKKSVSTDATKTSANEPQSAPPNAGGTLFSDVGTFIIGMLTA